MVTHIAICLSQRPIVQWKYQNNYNSTPCGGSHFKMILLLKEQYSRPVGTMTENSPSSIFLRTLFCAIHTYWRPSLASLAMMFAKSRFPEKHFTKYKNLSASIEHNVVGEVNYILYGFKKNHLISQYSICCNSQGICNNKFPEIWLVLTYGNCRQLVK